MVVFQLMIPSFRFIKSQRISIRTSSANITDNCSKQRSVLWSIKLQVCSQGFHKSRPDKLKFPTSPFFLIQNTMQFYSKKKKKLIRQKGLPKITFQICKSLVICETPCPGYKDILRRVPTFHKGVKLTQIFHFQSCFPNILNS